MKKWVILLFLLYIKRSETTYYQRNRETIRSKIPNRAKDYYENNKKVIREKDV